MRVATFARVNSRARRASSRILLCSVVAALAAATCGGSPTVTPTGESSAPPADPAQFNLERFDANLRALVAFGPRPLGSAALASARDWAKAGSPETRADTGVVLVAPLATSAVSGAALAEESSGAALALEVARALSAGGGAVGIALVAGELAAAPPIAGAEAVVYLRRACGMPQRRDLLSHRVLRERFFRNANAPAAAFAQVDAPHAALLAAGAKRVVALDAPLEPGSQCEPGGFGEALLRFVLDTTELLKKARTPVE
jgi:hypothetical protein